jgi:hypothetical protein
MRILAVLVMGLALGACGEKAQVAGVAKKTDAKPWEGVVNGNGAASDWKPGDQKAWEEHMRARAQGQNEYSRSAPVAANPS